LFLLAFAVGSVLGRFTVSGLAGTDRSLPDSSDVQNFWATQDRARTGADNVQAPPAVRYAPEPVGNHVCEGCDAGETRSRLRVSDQGFSYEPSPDEPPAAPEAPATKAPPAPPAAPAHP
jgi:hypothetical protein